MASERTLVVLGEREGECNTGDVYGKKSVVERQAIGGKG